MRRRGLILMCASAVVLAGCSSSPMKSLKRLTGQTKDTVLPGEREDILPPDQLSNPPLGKKKAADACDPAVNPDCATADIDQEATGDIQ
jgi:hypothetical protein